MSVEDDFFSTSGGGGDGSGSPLPTYDMPDPSSYMGGGGGGGGQYAVMSPQPLDDMPAPSYQPRPTDPYSLEEAAGVMAQVTSEFEATVRGRAEKEASEAADVKRRAEEELDRFYDDRTDEVARRQARSREQEEAFLRQVDSSIEEASSNPWTRICDLVDLKAPVVAASRRGGGGGGGGSRRGSASLEGGLEGDDIFRATEKMRSLIIQMKADTAHDSTGDDAG